MLMSKLDEKRKERLAKQFSSTLKDEIGSVNLKKVVALNNKEINKDICHTYDFCDANQIMLDMFDILGYPESFLDDEDDWDKLTSIATEIWDVAKENDFYI